MMSDKKQKLKRELGFVQLVAMAAGCVIGGWIAEVGYWFEVTGAGAAIMFPLLAVCLIPVGLIYGELSAMLPFSSSIDVWTTNAFGPKAGWFSQWMMFLVQGQAPSLMAFIFITCLKYFIPIPDDMMKLLAVLAILMWFFFSNYEIGFTGILSTIFFFIMMAVSLGVAVVFMFNENWSASNLTLNGGLFPMGSKGIFIALAVFSLKFIGFEMTPTFVEETTFPVKRIWQVIMGALFIPAILYMIITFALGGMVPWDVLSKMATPEPDLVKMFNLPQIIALAAIIAGTLHALTTIMGAWVSAARVLYGAAQLNQLPKKFMELNKHGQPFYSNLAVGIFSALLVLVTDAGSWVQYIYSIACIAAGIVYLFACADAYVLRKKHPEWNRPYKAPGGNVTIIIGLIISLWIIIGSCLEMPFGGYMTMVIYILVGFMIQAWVSNLRKKNPEELKEIVLTPDDICMVE